MGKKTQLLKILRIVLILVLTLALLCGIAVLAINGWVKSRISDRILTQDETAKLQDVDCVLVLGCYVYDDGTPSHMLADRLKQSVALYQVGAAPKLLMSGDHGRKNYDEVDAMKQYAVDAGIPTEDVFMDHAGFSTYDSVYRAKAVFDADKILIVTQQYHLYRALYIAQALGLEAYGVASDYRTYTGQAKRELREILARTKDFAMVLFQPKPTYLGDVIPISGSGVLTHDENSDFS